MPTCAFHEDLPRAALSPRRGPRHLEHPQGGRQPDPVGDHPPRPRRPDRGARRGPVRDAGRVDQPQRAADGPRSTPRAGWAATRGRELVGETLTALRAHARSDPRDPGLDVLDERLAGAPGRLRLRPAAARDRRSRHAHERLRAGAAACARSTTCSMELAGENVMVAVYGMGEDVERGERAAARGAARRDRVAGARTSRDAFGRPSSPPPPPWGELVMTPREAFLGPQEVVAARDAVGPRGRRVARGLPARVYRTCFRASA